MEKIESKFHSMITPERIELNNTLYDFFTPVMNEIHGVNYSRRFWQILLTPYITTINTRPKIFHEKELKFMPGIEPINSFLLPTLKEKLNVKLKYNVKVYRTRTFKREIDQSLESVNNIAFGFHDPASVIEDIPCFIKTYYPFLMPFKFSSKRKTVKRIAGKAHNLFEKNIIRQLPQFVVEYFDFYMDIIKLHNPKDKTFHVSIIESTYMRYLLAKYLEKGAKLYYYQHGAFYGEYQFYSPYAFEYSISDKYFTWGWQMHEKNVPWKAYRLNKFYRNYHLQKNEKVYDCLIVFPQINKQNFESFKSSTSHLINNLDRSKYKKIMIRPRPSATDLKYDEQFKFISDDRVTVDSGKSVIGSLISQSKLVIQYSYPSTNLLECFYVDHPSVVILQNDQPTKIVKPYYDFFLEEGVFHYNFEILTKYLNTIDVDNWWHSIVKHPTYQAFKYQFLRKD